MRCRIVIFILLFICLFSGHLMAGETKTADNALSKETVSDKDDASMKMLFSIFELKKNLNLRISEIKAALKKSSSETEKKQLNSELAKLDKQLNDAMADFESIATGIDVGLFIEKKEDLFNWKEELVSLVEPGIKEIKRLTVKARYKTKLKDELFYYENLVPISRQATKNIEALISKAKDKALKKNLESLLPEWKSIEKQIQNKLEIASMQLEELKNEE